MGGEEGDCGANNNDDDENLRVLSVRCFEKTSSSKQPSVNVLSRCPVLVMLV